MSAETEVIFSLLVKISIMILLGYILRKTKILHPEMQKGLSNFLLVALLPFSIFTSSQYPFDPKIFQSMIAVGIIAIFLHGIGLLIMTPISKKLPLAPKEQTVFTAMTVFANTGFIGFPLMASLFGPTGLLLGVVYNMIYNFFIFIYAPIAFTHTKKIYWKKIFINPIMISSFASILVFVSPFRLPEIVKTPFAEIGNMTVPVSMILLGASLASVPFIHIIRDKYSYFVSFFRMLIFPLLMIGAMKLFQVPHLVASVCVLMSALPCGTMTVIFAQQYDCAPDYASRAAVQSLLFMVGMLPLAIFVTAWLFPL